MKFVRVMNGNISHASGYRFQIDEINISPVWNPHADNAKDFGGFNFTNEENVLRWMIRGDTLYDVFVPDGAEIVAIDNQNTPNGVWRTNKIIVSNPRKITESMCIEFYNISHFPEKTYFHVLAIMAGKGFGNMCDMIINDKVNEDNVGLCISEYLEFSFYKEAGVYNDVLETLYAIMGS